MKQFYNLFGQTIFSNYIIKQKKLPKKKKFAYSIQKCWKFKIVHFDFILFYFCPILKQARSNNEDAVGQHPALLSDSFK